MSDFSGRRWITVRETAEYFQIPVKSVYDLTASGKLPVARVGRLVRIDLRTLEAELERQATGSPVSRIVPKRRG
jgi:excisionase family DNA binding protein